MKLTYEAYGEKITVEVDNDDVTMEDMIQYFRQLLLGAGFHPENVKEYLGE